MLTRALFHQSKRSFPSSYDAFGRSGVGCERLLTSSKTAATAAPMSSLSASSRSSNNEGKGVGNVASLPVLDIRTYHEDPECFVNELRHACHNVGFFLLKHNIPKRIVRNQLDEARTFFRRPIDEKLRISYEDNPSFRGYMRLGLENTNGVIDAREQIEYAAEYDRSDRDDDDDDGDELWPPYERLKLARNPFPDDQPTLKDTTMEYLEHVRPVCDDVREALCLALGLEKSAMDDLFGTTRRHGHASDDKDENADGKEDDEQAHWVLKIVRYPSASEVRRMLSSSSSSGASSDDGGDSDTSSSSPSYCLGVGAHTDSNFLTMILQDSAGGLQVYSKGEWSDVPCYRSDDDDDESKGSESVLVCNLGEQAQLISDGFFLATPHRVTMSSSSAAERVSIPLFYNPKLSATVEPLRFDHETIRWERPKNYDDERHWRNANNKMLSTVGDNTFKSLARSHPRVFAKFHDDLEVLRDGQIVRKRSDR